MPCSNLSKIYYLFAFLPKDNQQNVQKTHRESTIDANNYCLFVEVFSRNELEVLSSIWLIISFRIMSNHFKMYVTIYNIIGEKRIDLFYSIKNFNSSKEVATVSLFTDNINYQTSD